MAFFYWAVAEEFARNNLSALLPELVDGFCGLDRRSYDADALAQALGRGIAEEIEADAIAHAARVICEPDSRSAWTRAHFAFATGDVRTSDRAWQECLRLYDTLITSVGEIRCVAGRVLVDIQPRERARSTFS